MSTLIAAAVRAWSGHCARCGVWFAVPADLVEIRRGSDDEQGGCPTFCPNGHKNYWDEPEPSKATLAEQVATLQADLANLKTENMQLRHEAEQAEARASDGKAAPDRLPPVEPDGTAAVTPAKTAGKKPRQRVRKGESQ